MRNTLGMGVSSIAFVKYAVIAALNVHIYNHVKIRMFDIKGGVIFFFKKRKSLLKPKWK